LQQKIDASTSAHASLQTAYNEYVATHYQTDTEYAALEQLAQYDFDRDRLIDLDRTIYPLSKLFPVKYHESETVSPKPNFYYNALEVVS
jgi:hypothetical protein